MKTVLITGANKGIGYEVTRQLAGKGFQVFIGARNQRAGRKAADEITKGGGKATFLEIDVVDNTSVTGAALEFAKAADHLDVLVNNGYGRPRRSALSGGRRGHDCVACCRCAPAADWKIFARSEGNSW